MQDDLLEVMMVHYLMDEGFLYVFWRERMTMRGRVEGGGAG